MKRIGILTFHRSINYGAYMQCFSLSHYLQKRFPEYQVEVIDYESEIMAKHYIPKCNLSALRHPVLYFAKKKQRAQFQKALAFLPLSDKYFVFDGLDAQFSQYVNDRYDVVIVGSDAVFNWIKRGFPNPYVCPPGRKKLSYAASAYGMSAQQIKPEDREAFGKELEAYSFLGVRDVYTQELVQQAQTTVQPEFTCDPTVFLDTDEVYALLGHTRESFRAYIMQKYKLPGDKKLIGVMESNPKAMNLLRETLGKDYYFVGFYNYTKGVDKYISDINPLEWSVLFSLFELTITNFFHGTLLSLRNHTPVLSFDRTPFSRVHEGKIHDVMRRMELLDCCFQGDWEEEKVAKQAKHILENREDYRQKIAAGLERLQSSRENFVDCLEKSL